MRRPPIALALLLCVPACGDKTDPVDSAGGTDGSTSSTGSTSSDGSTAATSDASDAGTTGATTGATTDATTGVASDTDGPPPTEPPPARGVEIIEVTADQGVRVPIALDGQLVPGSGRNVELLKGRNTLVRAFYELDDGFEARDIFATLTVEAGGETKEYTSFQTVFPDPECVGKIQSECRYKSLINSFNFLVEGDLIQPDTVYSIDMVETAPGHEDDVSDKSPIFPTDGSKIVVGVEDSYMKMRVVVVPFDHDVGAECPDPPDLNAPYNGEEGGNSNAWYFGQELIAHNPADEVEVVVHSTVTWTGSASTSSGLLNRLQQLRSQDGADPGWYYYGVIRPCNGGPGFSGVAQLGGPTMWEANQRIGWGVWHNSLSSTAGTFVHEIGHEQGRSHIRCTGDEAGADSSYPDHPEGDTESYGTHVYGTQVDVHPPSDHDYMTYCGNAWVSEWGYKKVLPWIEEISSWELGGALPDPQDMLFGHVTASGDTQWWVGQGWWDGSRASATDTVEFANGGVMEQIPAARVGYERSDDYQIIAPLPAGFLAASGDLAWNDGSSTHLIKRSELDVTLPLKTK